MINGGKMMKTRKWMIAMMMCAVAFAFSACSDDGDDDIKGINVPEAVVKALKDRYQSATHVEWERKGAYYVADCHLDGNNANIWFDDHANWCMTDREIYWNGLPPAVQTAFNNGAYADWMQDDYHFLHFPVEPVQYVIEVEQGKLEYRLVYSEDGGLINTVDVTGKDDTIYPPASSPIGR